jgi:3',5'-nucleoside bisphosphate phosphatase
MTDTYRIDLHSHTTASDGMLTPTELVQKAKQIGLVALSVTDHDTVDGVEEAQSAGKEHGLEIVTGVELSTNLSTGSVHMLGYLFDPTHEGLLKKLDWAKGVRANRNDKIVERFNELGVEMTLDEVKAKAGGDVVGRPHFAHVLMEKGVVKTFNEAFDVYLGNDGKAYVSKFRFSPEEAIGMILDAGGLPVLAHPGVYKYTPLELANEVEKLAELGLAGIEVLYTEHTPSQTQIYLDIANRFDIVATGGSDFHGTSHPKTELGFGWGNLAVPLECLEKLKARV